MTEMSGDHDTETLTEAERETLAIFTAGGEYKLLLHKRVARIVAARVAAARADAWDEAWLAALGGGWANPTPNPYRATAGEGTP